MAPHRGITTGFGSAVPHPAVDDGLRAPSMTRSAAARGGTYADMLKTVKRRRRANMDAVHRALRCLRRSKDAYDQDFDRRLQALATVVFYDGRADFRDYERRHTKKRTSRGKRGGNRGRRQRAAQRERGVEPSAGTSSEKQDTNELKTKIGDERDEDRQTDADMQMRLDVAVVQKAEQSSKKKMVAEEEVVQRTSRRAAELEEAKAVAGLKQENKELENRVQALQQSVTQHKERLTSFQEQHQEAEAEWQAQVVRWQAEVEEATAVAEVRRGEVEMARVVQAKQVEKLAGLQTEVERLEQQHVEDESWLEKAQYEMGEYQRRLELADAELSKHRTVAEEVAVKKQGGTWAVRYDTHGRQYWWQQETGRAQWERPF